jgi:hypothetical protein
VLSAPRAGKTPVPALLANLLVGLITLVTGKTGDIILISVMGALTLYILSFSFVDESPGSTGRIARRSFR